MPRRWTWIVSSLAVIAGPGGAQQPIALQVPSPEVVEEARQLWNAPSTLRATGPYTVQASRVVTGDLGVRDGALTVSGHVTGRILAVNADVHLTSGARVDGDILVLGGSVTGRDSATILGQVRAYSARLDYLSGGDRLVRRPDDDESSWWKRRERWRQRAWSDLRLVSARTYNRVEGLPLLLGPTFGRDLGWGRLSLDAHGVWRTAQGFTWNSDNVGHSIKAEVQLGTSHGVRVGGQQSDLVEPVESWHLSDEEVGLATVVLHRDFRDYYNEHGGSVYASLFRGTVFDLTVSYADQRWGDRRTRDPWTIFRNTQQWRANPFMDEGTFHVLSSELRYDTRNDDGNPREGWYILADYEYGTGAISRYAPAAFGTRSETRDGETTYDRLLVDVRRYNRPSPSTQLNLRLVAGGWLSGDDLPMQRRFSVGGPGTMAGYDFRRTVGSPDVWQCATPAMQDASYPIGTPAHCERFAMAQVEYRGLVNIDPFGVLDEERGRRRAGWGRGTQWVLFADVGRGWLVGESDGGLSYGRHSIPGLGTFRTDVGVGLVLDNIGVYAAKSLSDRQSPINVFVRLRPRY
ncbi:MAG: BamA/TamA family outer membrane protein [Gemmatimonadaceae bacterium]|nr:BamA/TamA family outer membrane protein [Gemmatimonadaceae bacterium]